MTRFSATPGTPHRASRVFALDITGPPRELLVIEVFATLEQPALHGIYRLPAGASAEVYLAGVGWTLDDSAIWTPRSWGKGARVSPAE